MPRHNEEERQKAELAALWARMCAAKNSSTYVGTGANADAPSTWSLFPGAAPEVSFTIDTSRFQSALAKANAALAAGFVSPNQVRQEEDLPALDRPELELTFSREPIVGYRVWRLVEHQLRDGSTVPRLASLSPSAHGVKLHWPPRRRMEAVCMVAHHEAPWPGCECGSWAFKQEHAAQDKAFFAERRCQEEQVYCFGAVALWGRVVECELGYRALYAYPQYVSVPVDEEGAKRLQLEYGIPVFKGEWRPDDPFERMLAD